jgi:exodeoxyribonuclease VII large subunit
VRVVNEKIGAWIDRLGDVWVEGQVAQLSQRPGATMCFVTLRDTSANISIAVTAYKGVLANTEPPVAEGARVIVHAKPTFYLDRGTLSLRASEFRPVGVGELLARLERLKKTLHAEGLFALERKRPLPFLPHRVGLITGRASAAERDVLENAARRWPAVAFAVREVAVQGPQAVTQVIEALTELDADPDVDVIVIARGGGSVEDLLPFSDEALCRAVSACTTPVVSAIGHEPDTPLLDYVADVRASTPTDAAKRIVPDLSEEQQRLAAARDRLLHLLQTRLDRERHLLEAARSRPALANPGQLLATHASELASTLDRARRSLTHRLEHARSEVRHTRARLTALSPQSTLDRGYAVLQRQDRSVVRGPGDVVASEPLRALLAEGELTVVAQP